VTSEETPSPASSPVEQAHRTGPVVMFIQATLVAVLAAACLWGIVFVAEKWNELSARWQFAATLVFGACAYVRVLVSVVRSREQEAWKSPGYRLVCGAVIGLLLVPLGMTLDLFGYLNWDGALTILVSSSVFSMTIGMIAVLAAGKVLIEMLAAGRVRKLVPELADSLLATFTCAATYFAIGQIKMFLW